MTGCPLAREELHKALEESEMADAALLVLANKQDLPKAVRKDEMERLLNLEDVKDRRWFVQEADARSRSGVAEGFSWLAHAAQQPLWIVAHTSSTGKEAIRSMNKVRTSISDSVISPASALEGMRKVRTSISDSVISPVSGAMEGMKVVTKVCSSISDSVIFSRFTRKPSHSTETAYVTKRFTV
eukprot:TRINITY_DN5106_c0_g1_i1.p1 TRINITY_DN5106_c0_g1~~TRINITY_DN5106_c0_g1_i1.p1  ORF type:complete len:184 (+),score=40.74 TRINITY_DN5106_c0_g1_i1:485-1036(+)